MFNRCKHKWSQWSDVSDTDVPWKKFQTKVCFECNLVKFRVFKISKSSLTYTSSGIINSLVNKLKDACKADKPAKEY